jgi:hypothetical protein
MQRRVYNAQNMLAGVTGRVSVPEATKILALVKDLPLEPGQREKLLDAAGAIRKLNNELIRNHAANGFAGMDSLLIR